MIDYLEIQNYKMFEKLRLDGLGRVNLIVGKNNVGKSSLLEAAYLASSPSPAYALLRILEARKVGLKGYAMDFLTKHFGKGISLKALPLGFTVQVRQQYDNPLRFDGLQGSSGLPIDESFERVILRERSSTNPQRLLGAAYLTSCGPDPWEVENFWELLRLRGSDDSIVESLRIAYPEILRIALLRDGNESPQPYVVTSAGSRETSLSSLGEGMTRLFGLAFNLGIAAGGNAFFDEIENGLHYELHERVCDFIFKVAQKLNVRVFLTTHSLDFTRAFTRAAAKSEESGKLYRLDKTFGTLEVLEYAEEDLLIAANQGIEVR